MFFVFISFKQAGEVVFPHKKANMHIKSLAVFCGSKAGNNPRYTEDTAALGVILAEKKVTVIYGGGNKGIMGAVANASLAQGGTVVGVIPEFLASLEHRHDALTETISTKTMHERKQILYERCDAAIILPGGFGTLDELFEMLTWNQLDLHSKRIFFLNTCGFYDHLLAHLKLMEHEGFLYSMEKNPITVLGKPEEIEKFL